VQQQPQDEDELQELLVDVFRSNGWTAIREYTPDSSQKRVDIYAEHDAYGTVGIETKHIRSDRDGARLAEAYIQVTRDYWRKRYNGDKVLLWAVAPYFAPGKLTGVIDDGQLRDFVREFITATGVGYLDCHNGTLVIQFSGTGGPMAVPIAGPYTDTYRSRLDIESVREQVRTRRRARDGRL
jgi:hypothetical protein